MVCKKETQDKCLISLFNYIGIETGNRKESESISRIGIRIDQIQTIPNPSPVTLTHSPSKKTGKFHKTHFQHNIATSGSSEGNEMIGSMVLFSFLYI